jgi:cysteine desulfuration protein SufE
MNDFTPPALKETRDGFLELDEKSRLEFLLEFANDLPPLPPHYAEHEEELERVEECQSPVFIIVDVDNDVVTVHATAPLEAPTTRGFASILVQGLTGLASQAVLDCPEDFPLTLGLTKIVSPLRLRGLSGMLWRIKRQVAEKSSAG